MLIAGPCALESREQLRLCVNELKSLPLTALRASLWKPRTQPGWSGLGDEGIHLLLEETLSHGITPATEVLCASHAKSLIQALNSYGEKASLLVWIGARNQNHFEQRQIAREIMQSDASISLLFKNPIWEDEKHWQGIYEHFIEEGFPKEKLLSCHRGFAPGRALNPSNFRNIPNYPLAMQMKSIMGIPMLLDPSHISGNHHKFYEVLAESNEYNFDGHMIEVHPYPKKALTDKEQQLSLSEFLSIAPQLFSYANL